VSKLTALTVAQHLGQGANQAFEDIYHLTRLLDQHNGDRQPLHTSALSAIFAEYEDIRIARTSALVQGARKMGELRVVQGPEACKVRDEYFRKAFEDGSAAKGLLKIYEESLNFYK
jgi:salicylate hydroxylase